MPESPALMAPPSNIAHYRITSKLGEGGMGAVYRATDTKLNRDVAIKVLPPAFAEDTARMARFEREAQVLASLSHPNIAAIYGIEQNAIVMELVEGPDLKGPVPIDTAIDYARQIAAGLEAAHERGIVHRDLKPANIKVTPEGIVKLLDFGLAKATEQSSAAAPTASPTLSPTLSLAMTQAGMILGTAAYMSPEQARGKPVDRRADIWAFGVVLYELLTGKMLFGGGETISDSLAAVLTREPDYNALPKSTPANLRRLLEHCLRKDPRLRLRDIGDARITLDEPPATVSAAPSKPAWLPWTLAAASILALAAYAAWRETRPAPPPPAMARLSLNLPAHLSLDLAGNGALALSRDGSRIAVVLRGEDGKTRIYTRTLRESTLAPLPATEDASEPFFSPDGRWIAYSDNAAGTLKKVALEGGTPIVLCRAQAIRGASWGDDGNIVFSPATGAPLVRVPSTGGSPAPLTKLQPDERTHRWPQILPGGATVLFTVHDSNSNYDDANIDVVMLRTGERRTLVRGGFHARYVSTGHLLYLRQGKLFAAPFDLRKLELSGAAVPLVEGILSSTTGGAFFDVAGDGSLLYAPGRATTGTFDIALFDEFGKSTPVQPTTGTYSFPAFSPDGKRLAFTVSRPNGSDVWVKDLDRDVTARLTLLPGFANPSSWAPDGKSLLFRIEANTGTTVIYQTPADGSGAPKIVEGEWSRTLNWAISPDGKFLIAQQSNANGGTSSLRLAALQGTPGALRLGKFEDYATGAGSRSFPRFSPDGRWVAYVSDESGSYEVYVKAFPGRGGRWQVSSGGGTAPLWSRHSRELFFQSADRRVLRVEYTATADSVSFGRPRPWGNVRPANLGGGYAYDLSPDGKHLVAVVFAGGAEVKPITELAFLVNFFDELRRKLP